MVFIGFVNGNKSDNDIDIIHKVGINIGDIAPEISLQDPQGNTIALSSLRGKAVLIDFWASWCRPCRMENPNVVAAYHKFKDWKFNSDTEGFTIFSVSLDTKKSSWINAIAKDGLVWDTHVSDFKGWKSLPVATYRVRGIPFAMLIDGKGVIVAIAPRGVALEQALNELKTK